MHVAEAENHILFMLVWAKAAVVVESTNSLQIKTDLMLFFFFLQPNAA